MLNSTEHEISTAKSKILKANFFALNLSDGVFINVKMSTIVRILTFTSRIIFNMKKVKIVPSFNILIYEDIYISNVYHWSR